MDTPKAGANGFSLVEVIVAMMVLTFGLLAMAASTGYVFNQLRSTAFDTQRQLARQQVVEQMRGMFWDSIPSTARTTTVGRYTMTYQGTMVVNGIKRVRIITQGPAYRARRGARTTVSDTINVDVVRPI